MPTPTDIRVWRRVVLVAVYLAPLVMAARLLVSANDPSLLPWYAALLAVFFILFTLVWVRPRLLPVVLHVVFLVQSVIIVALFVLDTEQDSVADLFVMLAFQVALVFGGWARRLWIAVFVVLMFVPPMVLLEPLHGLSLALTRIAIAAALTALAVTSQEIKAARDESRDMLSRLESANLELRRYAVEVDDLAALQERNRLARELHDSVSQAMFSILLAVRSAQVMRSRQAGDATAADGPAGDRAAGAAALDVHAAGAAADVAAQLELLQGLTQDALSRMRGFIADLRPRS